jgi:OmcA/MtrC family decaheme c-type cytochrome
MIHSIHAAGVRSTPFNFIRGNPNATGGAGRWSSTRSSTRRSIADCAACHKPGTYALPNNANYAWTVVDAEPALGATTRRPSTRCESVRQGPAAGTCGSCHDSSSAKAHFAMNTSVDIGAESCSVCHGPGRLNDPAAAHKR